MDLTRDVTYRGYVLNDEDIQAAIQPITGDALNPPGITGCVIDSVDMSDVDVVQFLEKRSQGDGMDAGDVFLGARRIRMAGTLYATTRASLFDALHNLRAALNPVLAMREEPADHGYQPLYFSVPTNDEDFAGTIDQRMLVMPRAFSAQFDRDQSGGEADDPLAIPWQATLIARDPTIQGALAQDFDHSGQTEVTGATAAAATNLVTKASHGLVAGDRVRFTSLTGGTGLATTITYYVISSGLTANDFKVSLTSGGAEVDITVNYSNANYVKSITDAGTLTNRGTYIAPVNALWLVGAASGSIVGTIGDGQFTIAVPSSTGPRTIRFKGEDRVLTVEENGVELPQMSYITWNSDTTWPYIDPGDRSYSITFHGCIVDTTSHFWFYERYA